jgi:hypothetical protein
MSADSEEREEGSFATGEEEEPGAPEHEREGSFGTTEQD